VNDLYDDADKQQMLRLARETLQHVTATRQPPTIDLESMRPALRRPAACFVSFHRRVDGALRGCTGTLIARQPLALEIAEITVQTAFSDPRFMPVRSAEVPDLRIEISVLTPPEPLTFDGPDDLIARLKPLQDGVTLKLNGRRATFLPQVWESYPDPVIFLSLLSEKMGYDADAWRDPALEVETYRAIVIEEP
jgi:AmmeMemoRadiSam system protein A